MSPVETKKKRVAWNKGLRGRTYEEVYGEEKAQTVRQKISSSNLGKHSRQEDRKCQICGKISKFRKCYTPKTCSKVCRYILTSRTLLGRTRKPATVEKMRRSLKGNVPWCTGLDKSDPRIATATIKMVATRKARNNYKGINKGIKRSEETKQKIRKKILALYDDPKYREKKFVGEHRSPNGLELTFSSWLLEWDLSQVHFTGDRQFWVHIPKALRSTLHLKKYALNPDYIVTPFRANRKIIELLGSYWHTLEETVERKYIFDSLNIASLFIWDYELSEKERVKHKVSTFLEKYKKLKLY